MDLKKVNDKTDANKQRIMRMQTALNKIKLEQEVMINDINGLMKSLENLSKAQILLMHRLNDLKLSFEATQR